MISKEILEISKTNKLHWIRTLQLTLLGHLEHLMVMAQGLELHFLELDIATIHLLESLPHSLWRFFINYLLEDV